MENNSHTFNGKIPPIDEINKILNNIDFCYKNSKLELPATMLLAMLRYCNNVDDVKAIERMYGHCAFIGNEKIINDINNEYIRLNINND